MRTPISAPTPSTEAVFDRPDTTTQLLHRLRHHRLHAALVLVTHCDLDAASVLDLVWPRVDLAHARLRPLAHPPVALAREVAELLHWHGCRQRLDRHRAGSAWPPARWVFVTEHGKRFTTTDADQLVATTAHQLGLKVFSVAQLHPSTHQN